MRRRSRGGRKIKYLALFILLILFLGFWLKLAEEPEPLVGRLPSDDVVSWVQERNKVTGELLNVEVVRCRLCGQVLSYRQYNLKGKYIFGQVYNGHDCGRYWNNNVVHYKGSQVMVPSFQFSRWLHDWQRRLRIKR